MSATSFGLLGRPGGCLHASEIAQNDRVGLTNGAEAIVQGLTARERSHSLAAGVTD
jgi:hypothetical protein